jgi:protease I
VLMLLVLGCQRQREREVTPMPSLQGKKVLMIIAHSNFRDEELQEPKRILEQQGAKVTIASSSVGSAKGMLGATVKPDILIDQANVADYDAVIFIGGTGASEYWDNPKAHDIARTTLEANKILGAICIAPVTLARAGVLDEKRATVFGSERSKLEAAGCNYTGKDVEIDGNIITGNGPGAARKFGEAIAKALAQ